MTQPFFRVFPAIDLLDGKSVRLRKGQRFTAHCVHEDPVAQILDYVKSGARFVHIVNLNAAFDDIPSHQGARASDEMIKRLIDEAAVAPVQGKTSDESSIESSVALSVSLDLVVQVGGGVRSRAAALRLFELGVHRVVVGTWALREPDKVCALAKEYPGRVIVGLDTMGGKLAGQGWTEQAHHLEPHDFARKLFDGGVQEALCTQIESDGMLTGVDVKPLLELSKKSGLNIIASGGVGHINDVESLSQLATQGITGVIIGKALHAEKFALADALSFQK